MLNNILWAPPATTSMWPTTARTATSAITTTCTPTAAGKLVHWDIDFTDILDWQDDVAQFDLHSEGTTVLNPTLDRPRFAGLRSTISMSSVNVFAGVRNSSPTVNAGDPDHR